jgi:hypothetical protein
MHAIGGRHQRNRDRRCRGSRHRQMVGHYVQATRLVVLVQDVLHLVRKCGGLHEDEYDPEQRRQTPECPATKPGIHRIPPGQQTATSTPIP